MKISSEPSHELSPVLNTGAGTHSEVGSHHTVLSYEPVEQLTGMQVMPLCDNLRCLLVLGKKKKKEPGMVTHACNSSTLEAEAGGLSEV